MHNTVAKSKRHKAKELSPLCVQALPPDKLPSKKLGGATRFWKSDWILAAKDLLWFQVLTSINKYEKNVCLTTCFLKKNVIIHRNFSNANKWVKKKNMFWKGFITVLFLKLWLIGSTARTYWVETHVGRRGGVGVEVQLTALNFAAALARSITLENVILAPDKTVNSPRNGEVKFQGRERRKGKSSRQKKKRETSFGEHGTAKAAAFRKKKPVNKAKPDQITIKQGCYVWLMYILKL